MATLGYIGHAIQISMNFSNYIGGLGDPLAHGPNGASEFFARARAGKENGTNKSVCHPLIRFCCNKKSNHNLLY